jgi:hypothetical protein
MWSMDYSSICLMGGHFDAAKKEMLNCYHHIETRQDTDSEKAAAVSNEALKVFKGEPFERAMLCTYLGMLHYMEGDYNNARIFCARADMSDATTEENCVQFRHDFRLAHYWLGRSYLKQGDEGNARVAFQKASQKLVRDGQAREEQQISRAHTTGREKRIELEKKSYQIATTGETPVFGAVDMSASPHQMGMPECIAAYPQAASLANPVLHCATSPSEFFSPDYQKKVNLIVVVEMGTAPVKYLAGENGCVDNIIRSHGPERSAMVYLNGHKAGAAFNMLDMFHQADTRGRSEKDDVQLAKGVTQSILRRLPYVGMVAAYWDVRADGRYWRLLPGEVCIFAACVAPGNYTLCVKTFDANGNLLPRYRLTRYSVPVQANKENIIMLHTKYGADNTYVPPVKN